MTSTIAPSAAKPCSTDGNQLREGPACLRALPATVFHLTDASATSTAGAPTQLVISTANHTPYVFPISLLRRVLSPAIRQLSIQECRRFRKEARDQPRLTSARQDTDIGLEAQDDHQCCASITYGHGTAADMTEDDSTRHTPRSRGHRQHSQMRTLRRSRGKRERSSFLGRPWCRRLGIEEGGTKNAGRMGREGKRRWELYCERGR